MIREFNHRPFAPATSGLTIDLPILLNMKNNYVTKLYRDFKSKCIFLCQTRLYTGITDLAVYYAVGGGWLFNTFVSQCQTTAKLSNSSSNVEQILKQVTIIMADRFTLQPLEIIQSLPKFSSWPVTTI